jgi:hypothetical protein
MLASYAATLMAGLGLMAAGMYAAWRAIGTF